MRNCRFRVGSILVGLALIAGCANAKMEPPPPPPADISYDLESVEGATEEMRLCSEFFAMVEVERATNSILRSGVICANTNGTCNNQLAKNAIRKLSLDANQRKFEIVKQLGVDSECFDFGWLK